MPTRPGTGAAQWEIAEGDPLPQIDTQIPAPNAVVPFPQTMNPPCDPFLLAEYESLRREIELEIKELGEFLRYGFLTSGGIWSWLLTRPPSRGVTIAYFVPFLVTALLYVETTLVRRSIFTIGSYIRKVEQHFVLPAGLGWERYIQQEKRKSQFLMRWEHLVWNLLWLLNLVAALTLWRVHHV